MKKISIDSVSTSWEGIWNFGPEIDSLFPLLCKSMNSLRTVHLADCNSCQRNLLHLAERLLYLPYLVDFRCYQRSDEDKVRFLLSSNFTEPKLLQDTTTVNSSSRGLSKALLILYLPTLDFHDRLTSKGHWKSLSSLKVTTFYSHLTRKKVLSTYSHSFKHLGIKLTRSGDHDSDSPIRYPNLEVLEIEEMDSRFSNWMKVSSTLKLFHNRFHRGTPSFRQIRASI